ncbi:MAG: hypothetical protein ACI92Z_003833 [Paracoccaceae bacterium]|jgi:hypothetical protein
MTNTQDFTKAFKDVDLAKAFKDITGSFSVDTAAFDDTFKSSASLNEKLSGVALTAAEQSSAISSKWAKDTLAKLTAVSAAKSEPADYSAAISEFATASAQAASEYLSAYTEIAKRAQMETVELLMAAGKGISEEATSAVKKATKKAA